jgi:hypothetical protein
MSLLDRPLAVVKELVFAETGDAGKVCQLSWCKDKISGTATLMVPHAAYNRFSNRAALRCLQIKAPNARKITQIKSEYGRVNMPGCSYMLIRVEFVA